MTGRVIIVTGANSGIGHECCRYLCEGGNDVILACRNEERGNNAIQSIINENPNALATFMKLDLASMESIRSFVTAFHNTGKKLYALVNNAAVAYAPGDVMYHTTQDHFEEVLGVNYLGHFLLSNLLLDDLKTTAGQKGCARIINVTAKNHNVQNKKTASSAELDLDNLFLTKLGTYNADRAYKNSKLCNVLFTYELSRRLQGTGVTVNAVSPGTMPTTKLNRNSSSAKKFLMKWVVHRALRFTHNTQTVGQGAQAVINMALNQDLSDVTGKYYYKMSESQSSTESMDEELQRKVWDISARYVSLEGYEPLEAPERELPPPTKDTEQEKEIEQKNEDTPTEVEAKDTVVSDTSTLETTRDLFGADSEKAQTETDKKPEKETEVKSEWKKETSPIVPSNEQIKDTEE